MPLSRTQYNKTAACCLFNGMQRENTAALHWDLCAFNFTDSERVTHTRAVSTAVKANPVLIGCRHQRRTLDGHGTKPSQITCWELLILSWYFITYYWKSKINRNVLKFLTSVEIIRPLNHKIIMKLEFLNRKKLFLTHFSMDRVEKWDKHGKILKKLNLTIELPL